MSGIGEESPARVSGRMQVRLADLIFVVMAVGLATAIARGARNVWVTRPAPWKGTTAVAAERVAGLVLEVGAVWLAIVLAWRMLVLVRGRRRGADCALPPFLVKLGWRALAIGLLLGLAMRESWVLRVDPRSLDARWSTELGWQLWYDVREALVPICTTLAMIGIALGMGAGRLLARPGPTRRRPYWLFVPLAALASVMFMGLPNREWAMIPQLILLALTAVSNAMHRPATGLPGSLSERLLRAGIEAVPAALACLWLALLVARDFERARRAEPWATSIGGGIVRILSLATAIASGLVVTLVAFPAMHPWMFDGYRKVLEPEISAMILIGFGGFAAGLAARTLVPPTGAPWSRRMVWLSRGAAVGVLMIVLLLALDCLPASTQLDPRLPTMIGQVCDLVRAVTGGILSEAPVLDQVNVAAWLAPERLAWIVSIMTVAVFVIELSLSLAGSGRSVPFDLVSESPARMMRFLWLTAALTVVCLVAMPTLIILGQVIVHIGISLDDWTAHGWPSPL